MKYNRTVVAIVAIAIFILFTVPTSYAKVKYNGLCYEFCYDYYHHKETASVSYDNMSGSIEEYKYANVEIPETIHVYGREYKVTAIGAEAFKGCDSLKSIKIPASVTSIGILAFNGSGLTSIEIPNVKKLLGGGAFAYCKNLKHVILSDSVEFVGEDIFKGCSKLDSVNLPVIGNGIIGSRMFYHCDSLKTINIPEGITAIEEEAFERSGLTELKLPSTITEIGKSAFYKTDIQSLVIGSENTNNSVMIGESAFGWCDSLRIVECYNNSIDLKKWAFGWCENLVSFKCSSINNTSVKF